MTFIQVRYEWQEIVGHGAIDASVFQCRWWQVVVDPNSVTVPLPGTVRVNTTQNPNPNPLEPTK